MALRLSNCFRSILLITVALFGVLTDTKMLRNSGDKKLAGAHFRVSAFEEPPVLYLERDSSNKTRYFGITKDYMDLLQTILGFTYSFVEIPRSAVINGPGIEATTIEYLLRKEFDIVSRPQFLTIRNYAFMDFTYPTSIGQVSLIQPMPQVENRFLAPIKPFRHEVWICVIVAFCITTVVMSCTSVRPAKKNRAAAQSKKDRPKGIRNSGLYMLNVLLSQGAYLPNERCSARLLAGCWCLAAFVLTYAYNSTLVSYLTIPKYEPIVHTFEDLAESKTLRLVVGKDTPIVAMLMGSTSGYGKVLGDRLRRNPQDIIIPLMDDVYKILHTRCCAYLEGTFFVNFLMYRSMLSHNGRCHLTSGRPIPYGILGSIGIAKNSSYKSAVDVGILRLWENGIGKRITTSLYKRVDKCLIRQEERARDSRMNLNDLTSGFIILGIGLSLATLAFITELVVCFGMRFSDGLIIL